ncbi:MAG TPA: hypothetical protein VH538_05685 [Gaiellaceae bacterium]|jgi:hypothetical protein
MRRLRAQRRLGISGAIAFAIALVASLPGNAAIGPSASNEPLCVQRPALCTERDNPWTYEDYTYISGHDEPSVLFYSRIPGSGNSNNYRVTLPSDPAAPPKQDGSGSTWNFQLRPAYWLGMIMCDDQSAPNPGATCKPDSDSNIFTSTDPKSPKYLGLTPGQGYMEMQFYPPGWGPIGCTDANGNQDGKWCAALTIDSDQENMNTGQENNEACQDLVGPEPANYAVITKDGVPVAPPRPDTPFSEQAVVTPDTLEFNNGDRLIVDMHDTPAGFQVVIRDVTTGESGSMTASAANGFGHALFQPNASTCTMVNYTFHPQFSTSNASTRNIWAAHTYNVAASDEIGHFEYCNAVDAFGGNCTSPAGVDTTLDHDDTFCFPYPLNGPSGVVLENLTGCIQADDDFDGPSYEGAAWPGGPGAVAGNVPTPIRFQSPTFTFSLFGTGLGYRLNYSQVAFEADLPRIEGTDFSTTNDCQRHVSNPADPSPGSGCVNPPLGPNGPAFYPLYTTAVSEGSCVWQQGGANIPGTTNDFGGSSTTEYGGLLLSDYPAPGFTITQRYNNFQRVLPGNPCPATGR